MCCESNFSAYDDGMYIKITVKNNKVSLFVNFNASRFFTDTDDSCGIYGARPQCLLKLNPEIKQIEEFFVKIRCAGGNCTVGKSCFAVFDINSLCTESIFSVR